MKTSTAIIVATLIFIVVGALFFFGTTISENRAHNEKCSAWSQNIEQQRVQMEDQWFPDTEQFNQEVADFNKECAY